MNSSYPSRSSSQPLNYLPTQTPSYPSILYQWQTIKTSQNWKHRYNNAATNPISVLQKQNKELWWQKSWSTRRKILQSKVALVNFAEDAAVLAQQLCYGPCGLVLAVIDESWALLPLSVRQQGGREEGQEEEEEHQSVTNLTLWWESPLLPLLHPHPPHLRCVRQLCPRGFCPWWYGRHRHQWGHPGKDPCLGPVTQRLLGNGHSWQVVRTFSLSSRS